MPPKRKKESPRKPPPEAMLGLAARLDEARQIRGMKRVELARAADMTADRITRALNGESIDGVTAATVVRWAEALNVRVAWLLIGEPPRDLRPVTVTADDSPGIDAALDRLTERLAAQGFSMQLVRHKSAPPEKDGH